jgi:AcrR family transcriptional regulator
MKRSKVDERIRRTHERLGTAMVELIQEKTMDQVTVQDVLDRAKVGRSTFYLHYRDKDDLLLTQLEGFGEFWGTLLSTTKEESLRVAPVKEMFEHVGEARDLYRALRESGRLEVFFELAEAHFARGIERRLVELKRLGKMPKREMAARSSALAGSLMALMRWWIESGAKEDPRIMDEMFHGMVWGGMK